MIGQMIRNIGALTNTIATITATQSNRSTRITFQLNTGRFFGTYSMTFGWRLLIGNLIPGWPASGPRGGGAFDARLAFCVRRIHQLERPISLSSGPLKPIAGP